MPILESHKSSGSNLTYSLDDDNEWCNSEEHYDEDKILPSVPRDESSIRVFPAAGPPCAADIRTSAPWD